MSANLNKHLATLSKRGPHRVLVGDLNYAGIQGRIYAPAEGKGVPAVAFGHDWRKRVKDYHGTLRHLASWGIVVAAPDTETGFIPNHRNLVSDMESALQIAAGVKLGQGNVTVSPAKLGMVGHGMGGGAAVLGAVDNDKVRAVAGLYPAKVAPSAEEAAKSVTVPGLFIGSERDDIFSAGNPSRIVRNWGGDVAFRELAKGTQSGFSEDTWHKLLIGTGAFQTGPRETARALLTGFLLHVLDGEKKYADFAAADASGRGVKSPDAQDIRKKALLAYDG
ncbi:dienelactone hydrolase family protein [Corynebacterium lizhenjunii]|uniref:Dienelactone hydrolase family protein n=1 Tax=Corynebacterium lizhenjunii TaxID=2709394 RepID=A0A7T0PBN0_9CORY|nr:dienelactone hydrolase family protein [Corynebacterium lizhenjunii]QPK79605.1 dienelactone hydrolase family protein [Corynebacterium lizhenjunii]